MNTDKDNDGSYCSRRCLLRNGGGGGGGEGGEKEVEKEKRIMVELEMGVCHQGEDTLCPSSQGAQTP